MKKTDWYFVVLIALQLNASAQKKELPVRGTWITNVASDALSSKKNIKETIRLCKKAGINNVYVVVWNNGVTMYPSKVVEEYIGVKQSKVYKDRDPISATLSTSTAGMPNGLPFSKQSFISCLYLGSKICRLNSSPGYTTMAKGNIGIKLVI